MKKAKASIGFFIIASALIWAAVIVGCSLKLRGSDGFEEIWVILSAGIIAHLILIWGPLSVMFKKLKEGKIE